MHRKPMTRCVSSPLLLLPLLFVVACDVQPIGDLGVPLLEVRFLVEEVYADDTDARPFAFWRVGDDISVATTAVVPQLPPGELDPPLQPLSLGVFSAPAVEVGDVARLDLFYGTFTSDDDGTPIPTTSTQTPLATTRSTIWYAPGGLDRVQVPLPFDVDAYVAAMVPRFSTTPPELAPLLDNIDRAARDCGEAAAVSCVVDDNSACDIVTGIGTAACCAAAHAAFSACEAVVPVVDSGAVARLRWSDSCCG